MLRPSFCLFPIHTSPTPDKYFSLSDFILQSSLPIISIIFWLHYFVNDCREIFTFRHTISPFLSFYSGILTIEFLLKIPKSQNNVEICQNTDSVLLPEGLCWIHINKTVYSSSIKNHAIRTVQQGFTLWWTGLPEYFYKIVMTIELLWSDKYLLWG